MSSFTPAVGWLMVVPCLLAATAEASAEAPTEVVGDGASALPALVRVGVPGPLHRWGAVALAGGYGYTEAVLGTGDRHHRAGGSLAGSLTIADWLAVGLRFDGRYDAHRGGPNGSDDGWTGDPRLVVRARSPSARGPWLGGQLTVWAPGGEAPSLVPAATSFDLAAQGAVPLGRWVIAANVGFRLDRSAEALPDPGRLSGADRLAYGASDWNALLVGLGARFRPVPKVELLAEGTWDMLVGTDAPSALESPLRVTAGARWAMSRRMALSGLCEVGASSRPDVGAGQSLTPIEPRFSVLLGLGISLDPAERPVTVVHPRPRPPPPPPVRQPVVEAPAGLRGRVTTPSGVPLPGARVQVVSPTGTVDLQADATGSFALASIPAGSVTLRFSAEGHREVEQAVVLRPGETATVEQALPRDLPAGQIRGVISTFRGAPLRATVSVESLGLSVTSDAEGAFQMEVPPGQYVVVVQAEGYRTQRRRLSVEDNGVTFLNADMLSERK